MARARHPKKDIEDALREAESAGWTVSNSPSGHRWGLLRCGEPSRGGCQVSVWSTPRNATNHANHLRRFVKRCPHDWRR